MKNGKQRKVYESEPTNNYRELVEMVTTKYAKNIAYKYKEKPSDEKIIEKTYEEVGRDIKTLSTALLKLGLEGKRIALIGKNRYEWCVSYLAITTGNMIVVPLDRALPDNEFENLLIRSEAEVLICDEKFIQIAKKVKKEHNILKHIISMDKNIKDDEVQQFEEILKTGQNEIQNGNKIYDNIKIDNKKLSILLFTSGTTAEPKAVMLSQGNICANLSDFATWVKLYPTDSLLSFLPLHHTFECTVTFLYGFYSGCTVIFCDGLKYIQKNLQEYKISVFVAVPLVLETMYKKIQKGIDEKGKTKLINKLTKISNTLLKCHIDIRKKLFKQILDNFGGKLRVVLYGAAPMNKETVIGYNDLGIELIQGYGLTETSPVISAETDKEKRPGSVGLVFDSLEVKIDNPDGNGEGEILVKGPSVMLGYYNNKEENEKALQNGWFHTGDYGYFDKDEFLYVTGRKKDIIVLKNGKNVYPQEIEFLINKIPYIKESLVYQREQSKTDTMLCAKIVYDEEAIQETLGKKSENEYKEEIWNEIKEINKQLPVFKHIKKIEITTKELEKTTTQKVKRYKEIQKAGI